jgi:hypothetical protein
VALRSSGTRDRRDRIVADAIVPVAAESASASTAKLS